MKKVASFSSQIFNVPNSRGTRSKVAELFSNICLILVNASDRLICGQCRNGRKWAIWPSKAKSSGTNSEIGNGGGNWESIRP